MKKTGLLFYRSFLGASGEFTGGVAVVEARHSFEVFNAFASLWNNSVWQFLLRLLSGINIYNSSSSSFALRNTGLEIMIRAEQRSGNRPIQQRPPLS